MNRRKYISSLIGLGAISGFAYNYNNSKPTIASEIKFDDEVRIVADFDDEETKEFKLQISIDEFGIKPKNIGSNVDLNDIRVRGKTNTTPFGDEKSIYDSSDITLSNNEEVHNILDDTNPVIPVKFKEDSQRLTIEFIFETSNQTIYTEKTLSVIEGYNDSDIATVIEDQEIIGESIPSNIDSEAEFTMVNDRLESSDFTENVTIEISDEDSKIISEEFEIDSGEEKTETISFDPGDVEENKEFKIEVVDSIIDNKKTLDVIDVVEPVLETIKTSNFTSTTSGTSGHWWRGYSFVIEESISVNQLIGTRSGSSSDVWNVALYRMPGNEVDVDAESPEELIAYRELPSSSGTDDPQFMSIDEVSLSPGAYLIAQGRESGDGNHRRVNSIDVDSLIAESDLISDWGPSNGDAWRWDNGDPELLLDEPLNDTNDNRPIVGIGHTDFEE